MSVFAAASVVSAVSVFAVLAPSAAQATGVGCAVHSLPSFVEDGTGSVADIVEVGCEHSYAGQTVALSSQQLYNRCHNGLSWSSPSPYAPVSGPEFKVTLDNNGNATAALWGGPRCIRGGSLIEARLEMSPFTTATTTFSVEPPQSLEPGLAVLPSRQVESASNSSVATIVQVALPGSSFSRVRVAATELFGRCGHHLVWVGPDAKKLAEGTEEVNELELDGDGYAFVVMLAGPSCGPGESLIEADLEESPFTTEVAGFTILPPQPTYPAPPTATIESPASGGTYTQGEVIHTKFLCTENPEGSGLESCKDSHGGSGTLGTLDTSTAGSHTYTVTATSKDGMIGTASISYTVLTATCTTNSGTVTLSPGLTSTPKVQTMKIGGTLTGCTRLPFKEATYTATLKTAAAVSCSVLKAAGEPATGAAKYTWTPKAKASKGTLSLLLTETPGVAFSGEVASGSYSPLTFSGTASESYTGAATCSAKTVKKGTFSGSAVNFD